MFPLMGLVQFYEFQNTIEAEIYVQNSMKISPEFAARLSRMNSREMIRVIVFLQTDAQGVKKSPREVQQIAETKLDEIRPILNRYQGELLAERPNILGSIGVKITAAGVYALAESPSVKMILEDQAILPGRRDDF